MDSETYYIPVNYTDAGKLFGLFEIRNAIESVVLGLPVLTYRGEVNAHEFEKRYLRWFRHGNQ